MSIVFAQLLGAKGFGEWGVILSTVNTIGIFAGFGIGLTVTKHVGEFKKQDPAKAGRIIGMGYVLAFFSGIVLIFILLIFAQSLMMYILNAPQLTLLIQIGAILPLLNAVIGVQSGALNGFESFKKMAGINLIRGIISFPILIAGIVLRGLPGFVISQVVCTVLWLLTNEFYLNMEYVKYGIKVSYGMIKKELSIIWKFSFPSFLSGVLVNFATWVSFALLANQLNGYRDIGIFNAANQWRTALMFISSVIQQVMIPIVTEKYSKNKIGVIKRMMSGTVSLLLVILIPLLLVLTVLSGWIMSLYGGEFLGNQLVLILLLIAGTVQSFTSVAWSTMIASGRLWSILSLDVIWAAVLVATYYYLLGHGSLGLAIATLMTNVVQCVLMYVLVWQVLRHVPTKNRTTGPINDKIQKKMKHS
jgi:O-antigen/teichoic acid export membrane protein